MPDDRRVILDILTAMPERERRDLIRRAMADAYKKLDKPQREAFDYVAFDLQVDSGLDAEGAKDLLKKLAWFLQGGRA